MLKKIVLTAVLALCALTAPSVMPSPLVVRPAAASIDIQLYQTLISSHDSVSVTTCGQTKLIAVKGLDTLFARIVLAQARLETGNFKSPLARRHNNYYGMTHPGCGKLTTSLGPYARAEGRNGYASYASAKASAIDLMLLLEFNGIRSAVSADDYARQLKAKHYYECSVKQYSQGLNHYLCR